MHLRWNDTRLTLECASRNAHVGFNIAVKVCQYYLYCYPYAWLECDMYVLMRRTDGLTHGVLFPRTFVMKHTMSAHGLFAFDPQYSLTSAGQSRTIRP